MSNPIKKLFQTADVKVKQDNAAITLSKQELKAIVGAGASRSSRTDSF